MGTMLFDASEGQENHDALSCKFLGLRPFQIAEELTSQTSLQREGLGSPAVYSLPFSQAFSSRHPGNRFLPSLPDSRCNSPKTRGTPRTRFEDPSVGG